MSDTEQQVSARISGEIAIGAVKVPISASYPSPAGEGKTYYKFEIADKANPDSAMLLPVGDFLQWVKERIGIHGTLPTSLAELKFLVTEAKLDTEGAVDIEVLVGTLVGDEGAKHFESKWEIFKFGDTAFSLDKLKIGMSRGEFPLAIQPLTAAVGDTLTIDGGDHDLSRVEKVTFTGAEPQQEIPSDDFVVEDGKLEVTVPSGATTGSLTITIPGPRSLKTFKVTIS